MLEPKVTRKEDHVRAVTAKDYQKNGTARNRIDFGLHLNDGYEVEYIWIPKKDHTTEAITITLHPHKTMALTIYGTAAQLQDFARAISSAVAAGWAEANLKPVFIEQDPKTGEAVRAIEIEQPASADKPLMLHGINFRG